MQNILHKIDQFKIARIRKNSPKVEYINGAFEVRADNPEHRAWFIDR